MRKTTSQVAVHDMKSNSFSRLHKTIVLKAYDIVNGKAKRKYENQEEWRGTMGEQHG